jgi:hypothetical protein
MRTDDKYKRALRMLLRDLLEQMSQPEPIYGDPFRVKVTIPVSLYEEIIESAKSAKESEQ